MEGFYLTENTKNLEKDIVDKNIIFITALHHAREPLTLTMIMLMVVDILKLLRSKHHNRMKELFRDNLIFFLPFVNVDSYVYIN